MNTQYVVQRKKLIVGLAGLTLLAALAAPHAAWSPIAPASAQDSHGSSHTSGSHGSQDKGSKGKGKGKSSGGDTGSSGTHGNSGSKSVESKVLHGSSGTSAAEEESSDRRGPKYGGGRASTGKPAGAGTKKGDLLGDLNVILRDANGLPILDEYGHVQPLDADGNPIPLTPEGDIVAGSENLVVPVEFSRLSVSRSPSKVIDKSYDEAIAALNAATAITTDASGRLVTTVDGVAKTIDSPLENLALYQALLNNGYLPGFVPKDGVSLGNLSFLVNKTVTNSDMLQAASFLAAASDKAGSINDDVVVYTDSILGVTGSTPLVGADGKDYVDFTKVTYDRSATYTGTVTYLKSNGDGTYTSVTAPIIDAVFGGETYSGTQLDAFTQAADDARAVIEYVHNNPVPAE
ncbi:hypothetical protein ATSB10_05210 [Dyella thiooxydans]|uniref:Uncharacterized protein n=1 Tax=Dyella thiooxydans TaxID=445710 RepID=A0A169GPC5_9GAMM|nr:hypothetical protein [Dyella thiooxydans]AND67975.1 hypothetical protein ATSB10_05210 [Dyella thiooxydans]